MTRPMHSMTGQSRPIVSYWEYQAYGFADFVEEGSELTGTISQDGKALAAFQLVEPRAMRAVSLGVTFKGNTTGFPAPVPWTVTVLKNGVATTSAFTFVSFGVGVVEYFTARFGRGGAGTTREWSEGDRISFAVVGQVMFDPWVDVEIRLNLGVELQ